MKELNGFEIDTFNQYNLDDTKKLSICPLCSADRKKNKEKVLMLDWSRGLGTCQHCGEVIQLHTYKSTQDKEFIKPVWNNNTKLSDKAVKWFLGRGISQNTLLKMKVSEGMEWMPQTKKEENTIQFNYFINNELVNIKYRDGKKNFKLHKGSEKVFYNLDNIRNLDECIIVEGEMDALSFFESDFKHVVSVPNGATNGNINLDYLDSSYSFFEDKQKIYLATDNDEAGINLRNELIRRLGAEVCYLLNFEDCKDANEYLIKYGKDKLALVLQNAKPCPLENVITLEDERDELRDFYINGAKKGYVTGMDTFDGIFSTYTSQFIVVTGIPSSGKSEFVDRMVTGYQLNYGWKTAFASPENKPNFLHMDKLCRKYYGKYPKGQNELDSKEWLQTEQHIKDNFYFIDYSSGYDLTSVLKKSAELVKRKGIKCLVIDPYNKVRLKESMNKGINDYTNDYLQEIDIFCKKYDVLVILVAHPVKMKKAHGEKTIPEPTFYDIKGGGEFYDMSYHGLLVHRDYEAKTVKAKVLKVKFSHLGENQAEVNFKFSIHSGRYTPYDEFQGEDNWDNTNWLTKKQNEKEPIEEEYKTNGGFENIKPIEEMIFNEQAPF